MNVTYVREVKLSYGNTQAVSQANSIRTPGAGAEIVRSVLPDNVREHFVALFFDGKHSLIGYAVVATGTANSCPVHPREVFQPAILSGAVAILIAHNHPSGDTTPSKEDREVTRRLFDAGTLLGVKVLDHLVVCDFAYYSFHEQGELS